MMFCYINGTHTYDIFYEQDGNIELTIYTNNDYGGDLEDRKKVHQIVHFCQVQELFHGPQRSNP